MREQLIRALDSVHAEESLKRQTRDFLARRTRGFSARPAGRPLRLAAAAACLVLLLAGGGGWACFTPTSTVSVDVNPSLELQVNRFDRVISVEGFNQEGEALADALDLTFLPCSSAVERLLDSADMAPYLSRDSAVTITVVGSDQGQRDRLLAALEGAAALHQGAYCCAYSTEEVASAHHLGLSYGKYAAYLELQALAPEITPEEVARMSMHDIRSLISALSGASGGSTQGTPQSGGQQNQENGQGQGGSASHGHGQGYQHGQS